jgi:hypothetical protein
MGHMWVPASSWRQLAMVVIPHAVVLAARPAAQHLHMPAYRQQTGYMVGTGQTPGAPHHSHPPTHPPTWGPRSGCHSPSTTQSNSSAASGCTSGAPPTPPLPTTPDRQGRTGERKRVSARHAAPPSTVFRGGASINPSPPSALHPSCKSSWSALPAAGAPSAVHDPTGNTAEYVSKACSTSFHSLASVAPRSTQVLSRPSPASAAPGAPAGSGWLNQQRAPCLQWPVRLRWGQSLTPGRSGRPALFRASPAADLLPPGTSAWGGWLYL